MEGRSLKYKCTKFVKLARLLLGHRVGCTAGQRERQNAAVKLRIMLIPLMYIGYQNESEREHCSLKQVDERRSGKVRR